MWQKNEEKDQKKLEPVNSDNGHFSHFHFGSTSLIKSVCTDSHIIYIRKQLKNSSKSDPIQVNSFI